MYKNVYSSFFSSSMTFTFSYISKNIIYSLVDGGGIFDKVNLENYHIFLKFLGGFYEK